MVSQLVFEIRRPTFRSLVTSFKIWQGFCAAGVYTTHRKNIFTYTCCKYAKQLLDNCSFVSDENKFGQKLMEKMGWTKGKGLGANEDGMTEHVKVSLKSDKKGKLKFKTDAWIWNLDN